jgi:hypothetical protein
MKILEIINEDDIRDIKSALSVNDKSKFLKKINNNSSSGGTKVYHIKKNNKILKIWKIHNPKFDSYLEWTNKIKNLSSSNSYLPKIESVKVFSFPNPKFEDTISYQGLAVMEKLDPISKYPDSILLPLFRNTGINLKSRIRFLKTLWTKENLDILKSEVHDEKLLQALNLVSEILDELPNSRGDLHTGNWMIRKDGNSLQLVLTDPVT